MNLAQMERRATSLSRKPGYTPFTDYDIDRDVQVLAGVEMNNWKRMMDDIHNGADPTALLGGLAGLEANPPADALGALTLSASEQAMWTAATYTPIPANVQAPKQFQLYMTFTVTTTATASPTMLLTPRWGLVVGGATLGATPSIVLTASQTACPVKVEGDVTIKGSGTGTNGRVFGTFTIEGKLATPANGVKDLDQIFGYTAATGDTTPASGLWMGIVSTITTPTVTVQQLRWGSWN